jgi:hypothetical protein
LCIESISLRDREKIKVNKFKKSFQQENDDNFYLASISIVMGALPPPYPPL